MPNFKKIVYFLLFLLMALASYRFFAFLSNEKPLDFSRPKLVSINDNGLFFTTATSSDTVTGLLKEFGLELGEHDTITPIETTSVYPGMRIDIARAVKIKIRVDGTMIENFSTAKTIGNILSENKILLGRLDKVSPSITFGPQPDSIIEVTRINVEEKTIAEDIDFKTITNTDSKMGWREEKITQKGERGVKEITYKITYKNNREVSRVILEKNVTKEPVTQITTKGTYMEIGKAARGQGTWYSYMGGLFAASTSIPKGAYAKVTNLANSKSIVVQINDYGPQGKGRIIDLDKVAFQKIASIGAGVIGVKVEQILN